MKKTQKTDENQKNPENPDLYALLSDIKNLLIKSTKTNENMEDIKNSDKFIQILKNKENRKSDLKCVENIESMEDDFLENDEKNAQKSEENKENIKKPRKQYTRIPKSEKDIYNYINAKGEYIGLFYGLVPQKVATKVAKKIYLNTQKKNFDLKIYNKMTDRIYSYKADVEECEKIKKVNGHIIPILHKIKIIRC